MDLEKALKNVEIEPIRRLTFAEMGQVVQSFSQRLTLSFPELRLNLEEIISKMFECHMYLANIPESLGSTSYFYKTQAIYVDPNVNFEEIDDYIVHECIHYLQDIRDDKNNLQRMGLCRFKEFKVHGMALNEAAIQYMTSKILENREETIEYGGIKLKTKSPKYYPVLTSLINQVAFLIGENSLVESTIFSTDKFAYEYSDIIGEGTFSKIQNEFDNILEFKQTNNGGQAEIIAKKYVQLQYLIMTSYFDRIPSIYWNY